MRVPQIVKLAVLLLAACVLAAHAQTPAAGNAPARPRVGLVLGGGGARGTAHIGVLQVLDELHVPVDCIAGTSMGSLVGGAYASGVTPEAMMARLAKVDWRDLFDDNPSQAETNFRERRLQESYYPGLEFGVADGVRTAHGVVGGQKIKLFFNTLVGSERGERTIESLPLPLAIVATDIGTGEKVVFREGELSAAMRASMSVPALLSPVLYHGRRLVDGGLVDNLPIDEVRRSCNPDVVIAVDVGSPLARPEDVDSIASVTGQMINVLTEQNSVVARGMVRPQDIYIKPDLEGITAADFNEFREGAARGRQAALAQSGRLSRYALPPAQYAAWASRLKAPEAPLPRIDEIQIVGLHVVNPANVAKHLHVKPGDRLDTHRLDRDIGRIYGDGDFESVDYRLVMVNGRNVLRIICTEKTWGPDYLRFGVSLEAGSQENNFSLRGAYHRKWLNSMGAEWISGAQVGERANLFTDFYQPLDPRQRFFVEGQAGIQRDRLRIYQDNERIAEYILRQQRGMLYAGTNLGVYGQARLGWLYRKVDASVETGAPTLPTGKRTLEGWTVLTDLDQTDRVYYPTTGWRASLAYFKEPELDYSWASADLRAIRSWDPYIINARMRYYKTVQGKLPLADAGGLGGFLELSGYARNQILAGDIRFFSVRGEKILGKMPLGLSGDVRAGISLEFGRARQRFTETHLDGWQQAFSIYLGGETPLGPLFLGYGYGKGGHQSAYLFIGLP
ncbi:MAG: patatin-like phospholipase family protein [Ramlibacter sp.]